jgi:heat shock protein HspQ
VNATQTRHSGKLSNENKAGRPIRHPQVAEVFLQDDSGGYRPRNSQLN